MNYNILIIEDEVKTSEPLSKALQSEGFDTVPPLRLEASQPVLTLNELEQLKNIGAATKDQFKSLVLDITYDAKQAKTGLVSAVANLN